MKLGVLSDKAGIALQEGAETQVTGFAIDNRKVAPGTVFGAFQGARVNGEDFIPAAVKSGAHLRIWRLLSLPLCRNILLQLRVPMAKPLASR